MATGTANFNAKDWMLHGMGVCISLRCSALWGLGCAQDFRKIDDLFVPWGFGAQAKSVEGEYTTFRKTGNVDQEVIEVHGEVAQPLEVLLYKPTCRPSISGVFP